MLGLPHTHTMPPPLPAVHTLPAHTHYTLPHLRIVVHTYLQDYVHPSHYPLPACHLPPRVHTTFCPTCPHVTTYLHSASLLPTHTLVPVWDKPPATYPLYPPTYHHTCGPLHHVPMLPHTPFCYPSWFGLVCCPLRLPACRLPTLPATTPLPPPTTTLQFGFLVPCYVDCLLTGFAACSMVLALFCCCIAILPTTTTPPLVPHLSDWSVVVVCFFLPVCPLLVPTFPQLVYLVGYPRFPCQDHLVPFTVFPIDPLPTQAFDYFGLTFPTTAGTTFPPHVIPTLPTTYHTHFTHTTCTPLVYTLPLHTPCHTPPAFWFGWVGYACHLDRFGLVYPIWDPHPVVV